MIVAKLGSQLQVKSPIADNRGTCFLFAVKLKRAHNVEDVMERSRDDSAKCKETASQSLTNIRVLVSDVLLE